MNKSAFCIFILVLLSGCAEVDRHSKKEFKYISKVCDHIYIEHYRVFGSGALGGDLYSAYLTDSTHFRKYLGTYDDATGGYSCDCRGDSIVVNGLVRAAEVTEKKVEVLSLANLKRSGKFD